MKHDEAWRDTHDAWKTTPPVDEPTIDDDDMENILDAFAGDEPITDVQAFVDGWLARELEDWEARSKDEIRASLIALRAVISKAPR